MKYKIYNGVEIEIDEEDIHRIESALCDGCSWYYSELNKQVKGWCKHGIRKKKKLLGRVILNITDQYTDVDHKQGNNLDFRKSMLRACSHQENCFNTQRNNPDKGIRFRPNRNKWQARIRTKFGRITLGSFETKQEALESYRIASIKYHGEFSTLV